MKKQIRFIRRVFSMLLMLAMGVVLLPTYAHTAENVYSERVTALMDEMSIREKVTQMLMMDFSYWDEDPADDAGASGFTVMNEQVSQIISDYDFGAVIYFAQNLVETEQSYELTQAFQAAAVKDGGIPLLISADQEGGIVYRLGSGTALPGNMALGATGDTESAYKAGRIIGSELSSIGINTTLAPVVDVNNNANNPVIGLRSYGDDPEEVGRMAAANIRGLAEYNVIGCAKHFPGHGDTETDSHYGLPIVDKSPEALKETELKPYEAVIEEGIEMIMTAHILYPQLESDTIVSEKTGEAESLPATMSDDILTGLLKDDMGFDGIIVTDAMNMAGIADKWDKVQAVKNAIAAGADLICMPCELRNTEDLTDLEAILNGVTEAVKSGEIPESRLDDAVGRILTVKENRGILDYDAEDYSIEKAKATVGSDENRQIERELAAAAVTVVKNENNVLPLELTSESKVLMLCPYNNERAQLVMGWNRAIEAGIVPQGAQMQYYRYSSESLTEEIKEKIDWADTIIVVTEVSSTARMKYDHWLLAGPNNFVNYAHETGKISVIMSADNPYDVQSYPNANAIMAVYGCKGSSEDPTQVLTGGMTGSDAAYGPNIIAGVEVALGTFGAQGSLPVSIPRFDNETDSYTEEIVYPRGYGLTYAAKTGVVKLPYEDVSEDDWYYGVAADVYYKKLMTGMTDSMFGPLEKLSRAQLAVVLYRMEGSPETDGKTDYPDVKDGLWYTNAVSWASKAGIVNGFPDGNFEPTSIVTREQMATMIYRYAVYKQMDVSAKADLTVFTDADEVSAFSEEAIVWCAAEGIIEGRGVDVKELVPQGEMTRAECAAIVSRFAALSD